MAALLYAGPGAALSHTTAAWVWSLIPSQPKRIHVTTANRRRSLPQVRVHHSSAAQGTRHRGLPVSTVAQTLLALAATLPAEQVRRAVAEADYRQLLDPTQIEAVLGRGRRGSRVLRDALDDYLPELAQTLSVLEERFLELCGCAGIPLPEVNAKVCGLMVDAVWPEQRLIVELDGHDSHARAAAIERDRSRELTLRTAGYVVLRYTWQQVVKEPAEVAADLRSGLASGSTARSAWR